jgi:hypothetical protein
LIESCTNRSIMLIFANIQPRFKLKWLYLLKQSLVTHSRTCLKQSFSHSSARLSIHPKEGIKTNQLTNFIYRCQKWSDHGSNDIKSNCSVVAFNKGKKVSKFLVCLKRLDTILITKSFVKLDSKMFLWNYFRPSFAVPTLKL